jgi:hypothetical protein
MSQPPYHQVYEEELIDETAAESFPASDAPSWTATHAGAPSPRPLVSGHGHELRSALRADLERLARAALLKPSDENAEPHKAVRNALEDLVARSMLEAGRSVVREPVDDSLRICNVEAEQLGASRDSCVVVGARYDAADPTGAAMLLAILRELAGAHTQRTLRFVAFATAAGRARYVARMDAERTRVEALVSLVRLDLPRTRRASSVFFVANWRSASLARVARAAFRGSSRVGARAVSLPAWLLGKAASDDAATPWRRTSTAWRPLFPDWSRPSCASLAAASDAGRHVRCSLPGQRGESMPTTERETSWIVDAIRRRESDLADACATAAVNVKDTLVAGRLAELVFEHLRHSRPQLECSNGCAAEVDTATLRARARWPLAMSDCAFDKAVDAAVAGAIARAHAEVALFIDDACASLLVAPVERERLLRVAFCTASLGVSLRP